MRVLDFVESHQNSKNQKTDSVGSSFTNATITFGVSVKIGKLIGRGSLGDLVRCVKSPNGSEGGCGFLL